MLFPRVMIAASALNLSVARLLLPYLIAPFAVGVAALAFLWRRSDGAREPEPPGNPLQILPAVQMAVLFQIVLFAVGAMSRAFGDSGLQIAGAVLGLTDVDALTLSMTAAPTSGTAPAVAAAAIAIGILANCLMKTALAIALGTPAFRRTSGIVLAAMAATILVALGIWP